MEHVTDGIARAQARPAEGERSAVQGYSAQYRIAAELIHAALLEGDLDWVRVADPEAGRVDDIQIGRTRRVDAYQVKWGEYEDRVSFRSLMLPSGSSASPQPSLIAQLADGWTRLMRSERERSVHVHLVMRASPSNADNVASTGRHFQMFLRHAWSARATWATNDSADVRAEWLPAIAALREAASFDDKTFAAFVPYAHLDLGYRLADPDPMERKARRRVTDLNHLASFLFRLVADERRNVELSRAELVRGPG